MFSPLVTRVYRSCPTPVRRRISSAKKTCVKLATKTRLRSIRVDACLLGGDNGVPASTFARAADDIRRASRPIAEWPHVRLLRDYDRIGERLWEPGVVEQTDYYRNAVLSIEICGRYFDAVAPDQVVNGARCFVDCYRGQGSSLPLQAGQSDEQGENEYIAVHPIEGSACYQVHDGHHRLAIAYMKGIREVKGLILQPPVTTPVQDLLLDVLWLKGRRELYQPIDSPEVASWVLVRRCSDRLEKMKALLRAEGLMPPVSRSYLDIASSYGWFVSEMQKEGFRAEGVERDPTAISIGKVMYGLKADQMHRSDCVALLRTLQDRYDVTSCFSLMHHYLLNRLNASAEDLLRLLDSATRCVMFFDMGQGHEEFFSGDAYEGWDADQIHRWLETNTTFKRIVRLGEDEDAVPPFQNSYGRMLFACMR